MKISNFVEKLRALPDAQKKVLLLIMMTIIASLMIILGTSSTKNNMTRVGNSIKSVNLPTIEAPDFSEVSDFINSGAIDEGFSQMDGEDF